MTGGKGPLSLLISCKVGHNKRGGRAASPAGAVRMSIFTCQERHFSGVIDHQPVVMILTSARSMFVNEGGPQVGGSGVRSLRSSGLGCRIEI